MTLQPPLTPQERQQPLARLQRLLGGAELAALRQRLRRHFERCGDDAQAASGRLHLGQLSALEHESLARLLGKPARFTASVRLDIGELDGLLQRAGIADSLRAALEMLDGPIGNPAAERQQLQARWTQIHQCPRAHTGLTAWLAGPTAPRLLKRLARQNPDAAEPLLQKADAVLQRLPAQGLTRAQLAAETLGNAHALDNGQATATLVLAVLLHAEQNNTQGSETNSMANTLPATTADVASEPCQKAVNNEGPPPAEHAREVWARAGVLVNELARPALFLNLPTAPGSPWRAMPGEPGYLSLRQLLRTPLVWAVAGQTVYVCENPNLVAIAADQLGTHCAPLVCTEGMPAAAQRVLLQQLAAAGAQLHYHGDFDWAGLHIGNHVMALCAARPWRFGAQDYLHALNAAGHTPAHTTARTSADTSADTSMYTATPAATFKERDLGESPVSAVWDAQLAQAMQAHGLAIAEEAVVARLLPDLVTQNCSKKFAAK